MKSQNSSDDKENKRPLNIINYKKQKTLSPGKPLVKQYADNQVYG